MNADPFGSLEPGPRSAAAESLYPPIGTAGALWRGLRKRCPRCGVAGIFTGWFDLKVDLPAL